MEKCTGCTLIDTDYPCPYRRQRAYVEAVDSALSAGLAIGSGAVLNARTDRATIAACHNHAEATRARLRYEDMDSHPASLPEWPPQLPYNPADWL